MRTDILRSKGKDRLYARQRMGGALRRRPPQRSEDEKSITALAVIPPCLLSPIYPAKSDTEASVRRRSGHDKALPQSGRISALAGREGRLRACTQNLQRHHSQPLRILVTTSIIKSDVVPGLRPGAASLFSGGERLSGFRRVLLVPLGIHFVCCNYKYVWGPSRSDGSYSR